MPPLSLDRRTDIATRLSGGQTPKAIAATLGVSVGLKTVYRLKKLFRQADGKYEAVAASIATKEAFSREQLVEISQWLLDVPKLTLAEIRQKTVVTNQPKKVEKPNSEGRLRPPSAPPTQLQTAPPQRG